MELTMDLGLGLESSSLLGRPSAALPTVLEERLLSREDIVAHATRVGATGNGVSALKRLTDRHRSMAQMVAAGATNTEVAIAVGLTPARVVQLKNDPTFKDLVETLRLGLSAEAKVTIASTLDKLSVVGNTALDILQDRMEDDPDSFSVGELANLSKLGADRTGFGPSKTEEKNINLNFGDKLEAARRRVAEQGSKLIEASVVDAEVVA
jgi:DNA-binding CsgD family transcriptional regulator